MNILKKMTLDGLCSISVMTIDKTDAANMLQHNECNRQLLLKQVNICRRAMDDGKWIFNGETIVVDIYGNLRSGQHRLTAFLGSTLETLQIILVRLLTSEDVLLSLNRGAALTASQYLRCRGVKNANRVAAVARIIQSMKRIRAGECTIHEALCDKYPDYVLEEDVAAHPEDYELCAKGELRTALRSAIVGACLWAMREFPEIREVVSKGLNDVIIGDMPLGSLAKSFDSIQKNQLGAGCEQQRYDIKKTLAVIAQTLETGSCANRSPGIDMFSFVDRIRRVLKSRRNVA